MDYIAGDRQRQTDSGMHKVGDPRSGRVPGWGWRSRRCEFRDTRDRQVSQRAAARWCQQVALRDAYPMLAQGDHLLWTFYPFSDQLRADPRQPGDDLTVHLDEVGPGLGDHGEWIVSGAHPIQRDTVTEAT